MNPKQAPDEAGLYIHVPFCTAKCRYCGFYSEPIGRHDTAALANALLQQLDIYGVPPNIRTVYVGGGSPTSLEEHLLLKLADAIALRMPNVSEFTVEVNPGQVDAQDLRKLRALGVNRLSIGAQSFDEEQLRFLGRAHKAACVDRAVKAARNAGLDNISIDLIFAIPGSNLQSWERNLQKAVETEAEHISAYSLTYEDNTPLKEAVDRGDIEPLDEETDRQMYELAIDFLQGAGYEQYEISNFAKPGFQCRHNLLYWANLPYLGIGPAAASYWNGRRRTNIANITEYIDRIGRGESVIAECQTPTAVEIACETAVLNLRRIKGIDLADFRQRTYFDVLQLFAEPIERYKDLGLLQLTDTSIRLTRPALPIADSILADFAAV
jgi:oxygen-independent coproporphyrinogen-3 oxidase